GIPAALRPPATAPGIHAEQVAENVPKNIAEVGERRRIEPAEAGTTVHAGMTELVVALPLFSIDQDTVGFRAFLELFLRRRILRIAVRMILHGQFAVRALDLLLTGRAGHS